jgi:hypothetical protein
LSVLATSRTDQYFTSQPDLEQPYLSALTYLARRGCQQVGFTSNQDGWEYPAAALAPSSLTIEHVGVDNISARVGRPAFTPCGVLAVGPAYVNQIVQIDGSNYAPAWSDGDIAVLTVDGK